MIAGKQEVLTPQSEGTDGVLNTVVVDVVSAVQNIAAEAGKKRISVDNGSTHPGLGRERVGDGVHPLLELLDDRIGLFLAPLLDLFLS